MEHSIYTTYVFKDRSNDQLIRELVVNRNLDHKEKVTRTIQELMEQYSLSASDIKVEN